MHRFAFLLAFVLTAPFGLAQTVAPESPAARADRRPFYARIPGMFDFDLPEIDPPGTMKLIVHPHFGDFIQRDYVRIDTGVRWAINSHFELSPEGRVYLTHGFGDTSNGYGLGEFRFGAKYIIPNWPDFDMETSLTLSASVPLSGAPIDLTDGFNHLAPGFIVQHHAIHRTRWTTFAGAGIDLVDKSDVAGTPVHNQPLDDSFNVTAGAIYDMGAIKYTLAATYATTAWLGDETHNFFYLRPNILWYIPRKYLFNWKTQWAVAVGARISWGPDGNEISFSNRVRAEITFRQAVEKIREIVPVPIPVGTSRP